MLCGWLRGSDRRRIFPSAYLPAETVGAHDPEAGTYPVSKRRRSLLGALQAALNLSQVRVVYALRVAVLLALSTFAVQALQLPHGKWLLFTVASVSLPYAEDVGKGQKEVCGHAHWNPDKPAGFFPSTFGTGKELADDAFRISFVYFSGYTGTFACSTVGALGGAVYLSSFGWGQVGGIVMIRIGYVAVGILLAWFANCVVLPYRRKMQALNFGKSMGRPADCWSGSAVRKTRISSSITVW